MTASTSSESASHRLPVWGEYSAEASLAFSLAAEERIDRTRRPGVWGVAAAFLSSVMEANSAAFSSFAAVTDDIEARGVEEADCVREKVDVLS